MRNLLLLLFALITGLLSFSLKWCLNIIKKKSQQIKETEELLETERKLNKQIEMFNKAAKDVKKKLNSESVNDNVDNAFNILREHKEN